jgi:hypothetical protein
MTLTPGGSSVRLMSRRAVTLFFLHYVEYTQAGSN